MNAPGTALTLRTIAKRKVSRRDVFRPGQSERPAEAKYQKDWLSAKVLISLVRRAPIMIE